MTQTNQGGPPANELEGHRRRLVEIYKPETSREAMIIDELARVHVEKAAFERDYKLWMRHEATTALQTIQRQEADDFVKLQRQWVKAPAAVAPVVGQSLLGAAWLVEFWQMLVARLAPKAIGPAPGMDQACQALLAMGFAQQIQGLSETGWWWATRFLALQPDKDEAIKAWLRKSGTCDRTAETQQARHKLYDAPDPSTAKRQLYDEAVRQAGLWSEKLKQLKEAEPALREAQLARARCMGLKLPGLATGMNNAARLRDSFMKIIKFSEDRLTRARKDHVEGLSREARQRVADLINRPLTASQPARPPAVSRLGVFEAPKPTETENGQALEATIRQELLPRMAQANQPKPEPARTPHLPTNLPRPGSISNRKKQLARLAAREEAGRQAPVAVPSLV